MKKSEQYKKAILEVMYSHDIKAEDKLEIVETLMDEKKFQEACERREEEQAAKEAAE